MSWPKGRKRDPETVKKMREMSPKGDKNPAKRPEVAKKISKALKGRPSPLRGRPLSLTHRKNLSDSLKGRIISDSARKKMSSARKGRPNPKNSHPRPEISLMLSGSNNPNWNGGSSFEPYPTGWVEILREAIRERDHHTCQLCGQTQEQEKRKLSVHHIDYDKNNIDPVNLVTLCSPCHTRTNHFRGHWTEFFTRTRFHEACNSHLFALTEHNLRLQRGSKNASSITKDSINQRIQRVAKTVQNRLNPSIPVCLIGILKGGILFQYRLLEHLKHPTLFIGHIGRSSYRTGRKSKKLLDTYPIDLSPEIIQGSDVYIVDDVADTGKTLQNCIEKLYEFHPYRVTGVVLVDKTWKHPNISSLISGFITREGYDPFLVGFGMGLGEAFRSLPYLYDLQITKEKVDVRDQKDNGGGNRPPTQSIV